MIMSDWPITSKAVEAAAKAAHEAERVATIADEPSAEDLSTWEEWDDIQADDEGWPKKKVIEFQQAAITTFCEAEEVTVEAWHEKPILGLVTKQRLVGPWVAVKL
jgi:hypothetical protein